MTEESRQIYIGDMIRLTVDSSYASENDIAEAFGELEVVAIEDLGEVYEVTVRSFEPGTYLVSLAGQRLEITVGSTLTDISRETVFEPEPLEQASMALPYMTIIAAAGGIGIAALIGLLILRLRKSKTKGMTPYDAFAGISEALSMDSDSDLSALTLAFKAYLTDSSILQAEDSTTEMFTRALQSSTLPAALSEEIAECLRQSDAIHYSPPKDRHEMIVQLADRIRHLAVAAENAVKGVAV